MTKDTDLSHQDQDQTSATESSEPESPASAFAALGLGPEALRSIHDLGYGTPTPIQQQTIQLMLAGYDVIAQAPTGTGKTAAYGLPIVERIDASELRPQALILTPTRELAIQVAEAMHNLGKYREVVTLPVYGGAPYERQFRALARGVQVIVGTPGRLLDHLRRETMDLKHVRTVIIDEADEMLDMGFIEDIETILQALPPERQSGLFSATIPPRVARLAETYLRDPRRVSVAAREAVAPKVRQVYYEVTWPEKAEALARILDYEQPDSAIVFVRTRRDADEVAERLNGLGYLAQPIHGDINQAQRERTLGRFRDKRTQLLVATDVAARGLDIPEVSHIINYDLPEDADAYVHRIGRTGRAGRSGEAITLVTPRERRALTMIEHLIHRRLQRLRLPTESDVATRRRAAFREELVAILDAGQLDPYLSIVEDLAETRDPAELAAAAFKLAVLARDSASPRGARRDGPAAHPASAASTIAGPGPRPPVISPATPINSPASHSADDQHPLAVASDPSAERPHVARRERPERPERPDHAERSGREPRSAGERPGWAERGAPPERTDRKVQAVRPGDVEGTARGPEPGMARLFLRVGRRDKIRPADIVGAVANEAGLPGDAVGDIDIYDTFSFVEVPHSDADRVMRALNHTTIRGREAQATIARPTGEDDRRDAELRPARPHRDRDRDRDRSSLAPRRPAFAPHRGAGRFPPARSSAPRKPSIRRKRDDR
ncbi:MAG TPA: DEAD/DEAH box helicase [Ktedonobacterales bacterium]|nr:DEAD/DEAH box helicase [Ktedonobacterales bacterium]